jgi:hypothetical protein
VTFHGQTEDRSGGFDPDRPSEQIPDGELDPIGGSETRLGGVEGTTLYFRYCEAGETLPRGIRRIQKGDKFLCYGLRTRWPEGDAALGHSPR